MPLIIRSVSDEDTHIIIDYCDTDEDVRNEIVLNHRIAIPVDEQFRPEVDLIRATAVRLLQDALAEHARPVYSAGARPFDRPLPQ